MATEINELQEEENLKRKIRQKKRIRGSLIVINALLLCYFSFLVVDTVVQHFIEKNKVINSEIIQLNGKSSSKSLEIYNKHIENTVDISDFATYGKYLLTSSSHVQYNSLNYSNSVWLIDLLSNPYVVSSSLNFSLGDKIDQQIDLFSLAQGDYMLTIPSTINVGTEKASAYHYTGENLLETTIYSFPDEENHRKKITVKGKASSACLVISVEEINLLPKNYYDFVVISSSSLNIFNNTNYQVKYVDNLKDAYLTNASYAIVVDDIETIYTSNYVSSETSKFEKIESTTIYNQLDSNNYIRELGGYVFSSGYGVNKDLITSSNSESISSSSLEIKNTNDERRVGKYTLIINRETSLSEIERIIK